MRAVKGNLDHSLLIDVQRKEEFETSEREGDVASGRETMTKKHNTVAWKGLCSIEIPFSLEAS
mgnify:CR=1 FL=1